MGHARIERDRLVDRGVVVVDLAVTTRSKRGLLDFVAQRISAIVLLGYSVTLIVFFETHHGLTYDQWSSFFHARSIQVFSSVALVAICIHTWIGMWTIGTDYLRAGVLGTQGNWVRLTYQFLLLMLLSVLLIWGLSIVWDL